MTRDDMYWTRDDKYWGNLRCAVCRQPLEFYTHEGDYHCATHGFVKAIDGDGWVLGGHGAGYVRKERVEEMDARQYGPIAVAYAAWLSPYVRPGMAAYVASPGRKTRIGAPTARQARGL